MPVLYATLCNILCRTVLSFPYFTGVVFLKHYTRLYKGTFLDSATLCNMLCNMLRIIPYFSHLSILMLTQHCFSKLFHIYNIVCNVVCIYVSYTTLCNTTLFITCFVDATLCNMLCRKETINRCFRPFYVFMANTSCINR